jgi:hypothetical protein
VLPRGALHGLQQVDGSSSTAMLDASTGGVDAETTYAPSQKVSAICGSWQSNVCYVRMVVSALCIVSEVVSFCRHAGNNVCVLERCQHSRCLVVPVQHSSGPHDNPQLVIAKSRHPL